MSFFLESVGAHLNILLLSDSLRLLIKRIFSTQIVVLREEGKMEGQHVASHDHCAHWTVYRLSVPALNYFSIRNGVL